MAVESATKPSGLKTLWDTIVAPKEAFESLRAAPTWGWAFLIVVVLSALSSYVITPATQHAIAGDWAHTVAANPQIAALTPAQQQLQLAFAQKIASLIWIFIPIFALITAFVGALVLLIFNAIGHGEGSFVKYWAAQWNIGIVSAAGAIVLAVIVLIRGADSFDSAASLQSAMPSLASVVPSSSVKLHAFLSAFSFFGIWAMGLEIAALSIIGRVKPPIAWMGGTLTLIVGALIAASFAK